MSEGSQNSTRQESLDAKDYFEQYWRYCSSLRNWFVAYGIGGCILFLSDKAKIFQELSTCIKAVVVIAFLVGVLVQVLLAGLNKWIHWCIYWGKEDKDYRKRWCCKVAGRISTCFWIDISADLVTFLAFGVATVVLITALLLQPE